MQGYSREREGNIEEFEGDIIVPDTVDSRGWQVDADPNMLTKDELKAASVAARSIVGIKKTSPERKAKNDSTNQLFSDSFIDKITDEDLESVEDLDDGAEVSTMDLQNRLHTIKEQSKFLPATHREASDTASLTMQDLSHGSATFLSYIQRRQVRLNNEAIERNKDLPEDEQVEVDPDQPKKDVESIVGRYIMYARAAKTQLGLLLNLNDMITARGARRSERANTVSILQDWSLDGSTRGPIRTMIKADGIDAFIYSDGTGPSPLKDIYKDLNESQIRAIGNDFIGSKTVGQLQQEIAQRANEQRRRFEFWVQALEDSKANYAAVGMASSALARLAPEPKK